jgi:hypothetical protein
VTPSISNTFTFSPTAQPTATAEVPVVTDRNVFNPEAGDSLKISLKAPQDGAVHVRIYNVAGELVGFPLDTDVQAGQWFLATWDGKNDQREIVASGVYFVSVQGAGIKQVKKVIVLK